MNINIEAQSRKVKNTLKETIKLERAAVSQLRLIAAGVREARISFLGVKLISCYVKSKKCRQFATFPKNCVTRESQTAAVL